MILVGYREHFSHRNRRISRGCSGAPWGAESYGVCLQRRRRLLVKKGNSMGSTSAKADIFSRQTVLQAAPPCMLRECEIAQEQAIVAKHIEGRAFAPQLLQLGDLQPGLAELKAIEDYRCS
jgi:hypothetical protein